MKALIFVLVLTGSQAFAINLGTIGNDDDGLQTQYISWCVDTKVMGLNGSQEPELRFDCADYKKTCEEREFYRFGRIIITAACSEQSK